MDGFKKYSEKGFFEGLVGGLLGGVSATLGWYSWYAIRSIKGYGIMVTREDGISAELQNS